MAIAEAPSTPTQPTENRTTQMVWRLLRDWATPYWRMIVINLGLIALVAAATAAYPLVIREIVNSIEQDISSVDWIVLTVIAVATIKATVLLLHKRVTGRILAAIAVDLQRALYGKMIEADMAWHSKEPAAALTARVMADVGLVRTALERLINSVLRDGFSLIALIAGMFYIDWALSLLALIIFPLAIWPVVKVGRMLRKIGRLTQERIADATALLQETLAGVRLAKTYRLERVLRDRTQGQFMQLRRLSVRATDHHAAIDPLMEVVGGLAVAGVLFYVGMRVDEGQTSFGDIAGFIAALLMAAQPARTLGNVNAHIQKGLAGAKRVFDLLDEEPKVVDAPNARPLSVTRGAIDLEHVTFRYAPGEPPALEDVSLAIPGGARVALVGRSGAGKSTLFNLIPRLYDPSAGALRIDGQALRDVSLASLRDNIAVVTQTPFCSTTPCAPTSLMGAMAARASQTRRL